MEQAKFAHCGVGNEYSCVGIPVLKGLKTVCVRHNKEMRV